MFNTRWDNIFEDDGEKTHISPSSFPKRKGRGHSALITVSQYSPIRVQE